MKKQIWKFKIIPGPFSIMMPKGAEVIHVETQRDEGCMWVLVDPIAEKDDRYFEVFGTGENIHYDMGVDRKHLGTFLLHGGGLVLHLFERIN